MEEEIFEPQYPAALYTSRPNPNALLSPIYDWTFKGLFTQETDESYLALQSFISAVLGREVLSVTLKPNDYGVRAEIQAARLLANNAKKGSNWEAGKVYQISVLNFHYEKDDNQEMTWYTMQSDEGKRLQDKLNIIFIDLVSIRKKYGTPIEELTPVEKWGLFFSYIDNEKNNDYVKDLVKTEEGLMAANSIIRYMSQEDANWFTQNSIDIYERDRNTILANAEKRGLENGMKKGLEQGLQQGIQQGIQQGAEKKAIETAIAFLKENTPPETIARCVKLPLEKVLELKEKNDL